MRQYTLYLKLVVTARYVSTCSNPARLSAALIGINDDVNLQCRIAKKGENRENLSLRGVMDVEW